MRERSVALRDRRSSSAAQALAWQSMAINGNQWQSAAHALTWRVLPLGV